jgi:hypothetical protein
MDCNDLVARYGAHWYKTDDQGTSYISPSSSNGPWSILLGPTSAASIVPTLRGGHRAYEGLFTWTSPPNSSTWSLSNSDFSVSDREAPTPSPGEKAPPDRRDLYLIIENQAPNEPQHWLLFLAAENSAGTVIQVTGDAEKMTCQCIPNVEKFSLEEYQTSFLLAEGVDEETIRVVAEETTPPEAKSRREVRENCQGWCWRVVERLEREGVVPKGKAEMVGRMVTPIV